MSKFHFKYLQPHKIWYAVVGQWNITSKTIRWDGIGFRISFQTNSGTKAGFLQFYLPKFWRCTQLKPEMKVRNVRIASESFGCFQGFHFPLLAASWWPFEIISYKISTKSFPDVFFLAKLHIWSYHYPNKKPIRSSQEARQQWGKTHVFVCCVPNYTDKWIEFRFQNLN